MSNWIKPVLNKATREYQIFLKPDFANLSKTDFPQGLPIYFNTFEGKALAKNYLQEATDFFEEFESGYKNSKNENGFKSYKDFFLSQYGESIHYYNKEKMGYFSSIYKSTRNENDIFEYPRLSSHFSDYEYTNFPHGITIGSQKFYNMENLEPIIEHLKAIDQFIFHILSEYEKTL